MEQPDDPEAYLGESKREIGRSGHQTAEEEKEAGDRHPRYPTYWSWPEWQKVKTIPPETDAAGHEHAKAQGARRTPRTRAWWRRPSRRLHPGEDCEIEVMGSMGSWTEGSVGGGCQRVAGEG